MVVRKLSFQLPQVYGKEERAMMTCLDCCANLLLMLLGRCSALAHCSALLQYYVCHRAALAKVSDNYVMTIKV